MSPSSTGAHQSLLLLLFVLWSPPVSAQAILTSTLVWNQSDGDTVPAAQAFEARVYVETDLIPFVVPGTICVPFVITDSAGGVWTLGTGSSPDIAILRNGIAAAGAFGMRLVPYQSVIYLQGDDANWYVWTGSAFRSWTGTDPPVLTIAAISSSRWTCQAPLTAALVTRLQAPGDHPIVLRLYDPVGQKESGASNVWIVTQPGGGSAPTVGLVGARNL